MKFISTKYVVYMTMMPGLPHLIGPRPIILSGVIASNMGDAECTENVGFGSRLFSNSGIGCQALRDAPAGFTVLSAVGAEPSA